MVMQRGIDGSDTGAGAFVSRWGLINEGTGAVAAGQMRLQNFVDGTSNTIVVSEFAKGLKYVLPVANSEHSGAKLVRFKQLRKHNLLNIGDGDPKQS